MYFPKFPKFDYTFRYETAGATGETKTISLEVTDIFRKVAFTEETKNNNRNFDWYTISNGEGPEDIARKFYFDPNLWWVVLLFNDIIDPFNEWVFDAQALYEKIDTFLGGNSFYFTEQLEARPGDILVKRDPGETGGIDITTYAVVTEYDPLFRRINSRRGKETPDKQLEEGDEVYLVRKLIEDDPTSYTQISGWGETGCYPTYPGSTFCEEIAGPIPDGGDPWAAPLCGTAGTTFGIIRKKETIQESVAEFVDATGNIISPFSGLTGSPPDEVPYGDLYRAGDICGLSGSVLYRYITDTLPFSIRTNSVSSKFVADNDARRRIKILNPRFIRLVLPEISDLLSNRVPRNTKRMIRLK